MAWQTYNMLTKERGEIMKDGQSIDVPSGEQYVVTLAVEDLNSGVKDVTLSGNVQYACEQGGQVENKKFPLETQETKPTLDQENKGPSEPHLSMPWNSARWDARKTGRLVEGNCLWWGRRIISLAELRRGRCTLI